MILDFGCGDCARLNHWLKKYGKNGVIGMDVDKNSIRQAKQRIQNGTTFLVSDGQNLGFRNKCFYYVHVRGVMHHLSDMPKAICEISRTLNGTLEIEEPVDDYFVFAIARRVVRLWRGIEIKSHFRSYQLEKEIRKYFKIKEVGPRYSSLTGNILSCFEIKPRMYDKLDSAMTSIIKRLRLSKYFCTHVRILACNCPADTHLI